MFQSYFKEKFDVLRLLRFLVSSRYRRVRKMQLHLVLFALFIYTIFKEDNTPVICIHGPHLRGLRWNSRDKVLNTYFLIVPAMQGKCGGYNIWTLTLLGFSAVGWGKEQGCYHQLVSTGQGLNQGAGK